MSAMADQATRGQAGDKATQHAQRRRRARSRATMPRLILEARRIAATVIHGLHGRRRAGPGENFWQYPPLRFRRAGAPRRLAPLGARRPSLCARAGMGSRAHGLAVARPLALDGCSLAAWRRNPSSTAALVVAFALAEVLVAGRRARRHSRPDAADRQPQRDRQDGEGDRARRHRAGEPAAVVLRPRRSPRSWCCRTSGARSRRCARRSRSSRRPARMATSCRSSIRPRRPFPIPAASSSSSRKAPARSRPAAPRPGRRLRGARRAPPRRDPRRDRPARLELRHPPHRPAATELLLALHARMGAGPRGTVHRTAGTALTTAGRHA